MISQRGGKRGLSTIVATLIIILLVFVAVGILWIVVKNFIVQGAEQVSLGKFTLDLSIEQVAVENNTNNVSVAVKRNIGEGSMTGLKFIFEDDTNSESFDVQGSMDELDERLFEFELTSVDPSNLRRIRIAPLFTLSSGNIVTGDVKSTYDAETGVSTSSGGGSSGGGSSCTNGDSRSCAITNGDGNQTCSGGTWGTCNVVSCDSGYTQQGNTCVATCTDECSPSGDVQCSTGTSYQTCGNFDSDSCLEWGTATACSSGETCSGGQCVTGTVPSSVFSLDYDNAFTEGPFPDNNPEPWNYGYYGGVTTPDYSYKGSCIYHDSSISRTGSGGSLVFNLSADAPSGASRPHNYRCESYFLGWHDGSEDIQGSEKWIGYSMYIPSDWNVDNTWSETVMQIHASNANPPNQLEIDGNQFVYHSRAQARTCPSAPGGDNTVQHVLVSNIQPGNWYDFVYRIVASETDQGIIQIWVNGNQVVNDQGVRTTYTSDCIYGGEDSNYIGTLKLGVYKYPWIVDSPLSIPDSVSNRAYNFDNVGIYYTTTPDSNGYSYVDPSV